MSVPFRERNPVVVGAVSLAVIFALRQPPPGRDGPGGARESSTGFTLYMDSVLRALPAPAPASTLTCSVPR